VASCDRLLIGPPLAAPTGDGKANLVLSRREEPAVGQRKMTCLLNSKTLSALSPITGPAPVARDDAAFLHPVRERVIRKDANLPRQ
jgi:hypothetical protein